jgi:hypothetical protein
MNTEALPKYVRHYVATLRGFRCLKRREVRMTLEILHELQRGCAYTPAQREISTAVELLMAARRKMSVKNWGRGEFDI